MRALLASASVLVIAWVIVAALAYSRSDLVAPEPSLLLRDRHGRFLGEVGRSDEHGAGYWPVDELPPRVVAATLAVEDRRFWQHEGVDPRAVLRAISQNVANGRRVSGASTLAMQVARMQRPGPRSYPRKVVEALTALWATSRHGREQVLRHYLRIVPYGNQIHGIAFAARRYLDKPVVDLSWAEVAFLAAIPQSPARMNPFDPAGRRRAAVRGGRILDLLLEDGVLSGTEHRMALAQISELHIPDRGRRSDAAIHAVLALEDRFSSPETRAHLEGRYVVDTTIDLELQEEASWITLDAVGRWRSRGAGNAAMVVVDTSSLDVLAWVGSTDYFDEGHSGSIDYMRVPRSPGSTLKPFLYALALERGVVTPATVLDDLRRSAGGIGNADDRYLGPMLPRAALANSRNVPAADLLDAVGLEEGYAFLADLGLHDDAQSARHWGLGMAIGGMPVTLERLVRAYTAIAGDGLLGELRWHRGQPEQAPRRLISEATARTVTLFLADPMARLPSFPRMGALEYPFPVAAKTGTSSSYHDAWTVAWSSRYLVAAWVGHPDFQAMNRLSGYRSAAKLVREVLMHLHADQVHGLDDVGFPPPRGSEGLRLCAVTGERATPACDRVFLEHFRAGQRPVHSCRAHRLVAVDVRNGLLATDDTPRRWFEVRRFTDLGPRYASWQVGHGLPLPPRTVSNLGSGSGPAVVRSSGPASPFPAGHRISITAPSADLVVLRDPETPVGLATIALEAVVDPPTEQVVWYVNGEPFEVADHPYATRWPLAPGSHTIQARIPFTESRSKVVRVKVF